MEELLRNSLLGWSQFTEDGKFAVLLLGGLVFLWFRFQGEKDGTKKLLLIYTTVAAGLALFPLSAVLLMKYQTLFYDYEWIWSLVPMTLVIAFAGTILFWEGCSRYWKGNKWKCAAWAAACLGVLILCGNLGGNGWSAEKEAREAQKAAVVLDDVTGNGKNKDICLWAPKEIMAYARQEDGGIKLPYGRNMWEIALNAYSYDIYDEDTRELYQWMESLGGQAGEEMVLPQYCVETALEKGVNVVLLPETASPQTRQAFEQALAKAGAWADGAQGGRVSLNGYFVYYLQESGS